MASKGQSAGKQSGRVITKSPTKLFVHKLSAATSLLSFIVILVAGTMAQVPLNTTVFRAFIVILVIGLISRVLLKVLGSYEEINRGKV